MSDKISSSEAVTVHEAFERAVQRWPEAIAVQFGADRLTYQELDRRADALAVQLQGLAVGPDVPVGLCFERSLEMVVALLGTLKAGRACVPLDPVYPAARLDLMIEDCRPAVVLTQPEVAERLRVPSACQLVPLGKVTLGDAKEAMSLPSRLAGSADLAYLLYTSGSTGRPNAVAMEHGAFCNLLRWQLAHWQSPSAARTLQFASLNFDVAFQEIFCTLSAGGTVILVSEETRRDPEELLKLLASEAIERLFLPFVALQQLAIAAETTGLRPARLREVITAGEQLKITPGVRAFFAHLPGCVLHNQYGPTETHVVTCQTLQGDPALWPELPSIGAPIAGASIHLLDEDLQPVPDGEIGELAIGGVCLARGYLNRPELTQARFVSAAFDSIGTTRLYRSGDLARWRPDGTLEFAGRSDEQIKIRGVRVEPSEVEAALSLHPALQQAVVIGREDRTSGMRLAAFFVVKAGHSLLTRDLRSFLAAKLPEPMVPSTFVELPSLPLTPSGKVNRRALPIPGEHRTEIAIPADDALQGTLIAIWQEVFGVSPIGIRDDFFELGGHSLLAAELRAAIEARCHFHVPLGLIFEYPTIESFAQEAARNSWSRADSRIIALNEAGAGPRFFCIPPLLELARRLGPTQPFYGLELRESAAEAGDPVHTIEALASRGIEALRSVQAHGPYYLGGYSFGGPVIYEIAHQLQQQGEEIGLLVLIDPDAPKAPVSSALYRHGRALARRIFRSPVKLFTHYWHALRRRVKKTLPGDRQFASLAPQDKVLNLVGCYRPPALGCPIRLVLAQDSDNLEDRWFLEARRDWIRYAPRALKVWEAPGNHSSLVEGSQTMRLADRLRDWLAEEAQRSTPKSRSDPHRE